MTSPSRVSPGVVRAGVISILPPEAVTPDGGGPPVVRPGEVGEVSAVLALASREGWRVRIRESAEGEREAAVGGQDPDLVVATDRMAGVRHWEPAELVVSAGGGTGVGELDREVSREGQWLPLDPPLWWKRSLGGVVAGNRSGPLRAGFGTPRDHLLGATLVKGDGEILHLGGRVVKNVAGFDLLRLVCGSGGTLGVLAELTVRLHPRPAADRTVLFPAPHLAAGAALARRQAGLPMPIAAVELVGPGVPGVSDERGPLGGGTRVIVRIVGSDPAVDSILARVLDAGGGEGRPLVLDGSDGVDLFRRLSSAEGTAPARARLSLLPSRLPELLEWVSAALPSEEGMAVLAHGGAGVVRLLFQERHPPHGIEALVRQVESEGGSGRLHPCPPALPRCGTPPGLRSLEDGLREVFDPRGILMGDPGAAA